MADRKLRRSRVETSMIGGHFPRETARDLRMMAAKEGTTIQNLLTEALADLFVKRRKSDGLDVDEAKPRRELEDSIMRAIRIYISRATGDPRQGEPT